MKNLISIIIVIVIASSCNSPAGDVVTSIKVNGEDIPHIHFDNLPAEIEEIGISEIISDFRIIPLESDSAFLIGNIQAYGLYENKILVSTQYFPGPAPVFMFDIEGKFIREIGKRGRGPGEHTGYIVVSIHAGDSILIDFQDKIQLFNTEGVFLDNIDQPFDFMGSAYGYKEDIWFSPGSITGHPKYQRDSVLIVFHDRDGRILKSFPREIYPPRSHSGYTPTGKGRSVYKFDNRWKFFSPGIDTVFELVDTNLIPSVVLNLGEKKQRYNETVDPRKLLGKYTFSIVAENKNWWMFRNGEITKADVKESSYGWGGIFDSRRELSIIEKKGGQSKRIRLRDDIWELCDERRLNNWSVFTDNNKLVYSLQATDIKVLIVEKLSENDLDPIVRKRLKELDSKITENSNPVIFICFLKDKMKF